MLLLDKSVVVLGASISCSWERCKIYAFQTSELESPHGVGGAGG